MLITTRDKRQTTNRIRQASNELGVARCPLCNGEMTPMMNGRKPYFLCKCPTQGAKK